MSVRAELFTVGVIATFALLPVWLTSKKNKARLQWKGSLKGRRRGSFCKGLHISKVIPFSLPLSATNDLHDAARIQFHIYLFDILYHYWRHYCFSTPVSLTRFLSPPPASHLFFLIPHRHILPHLWPLKISTYTQLQQEAPDFLWWDIWRERETGEIEAVIAIFVPNIETLQDEAHSTVCFHIDL